MEWFLEGWGGSSAYFCIDSLDFGVYSAWSYFGGFWLFRAVKYENEDLRQWEKPRGWGKAKEKSAERRGAPERAGGSTRSLRIREKKGGGLPSYLTQLEIDKELDRLGKHSGVLEFDFLAENWSIGFSIYFDFLSFLALINDLYRRWASEGTSW